MKLRSPLALLALALVACRAPSPDDLPPRPPAPYSPSGRDGLDTPIGEVCAVLRTVGCPEGYPNRRGRTCWETYTSAAEFASVPVDCLRAATTINAVRACGDAAQITVRCVLPAVDATGSTAP